MKRNIFLQVITGAVFLLSAFICRADELSTEEARHFAATKGKELLMSFQEENLEKRYKQLDAMFLEYIDVEYVSRFVLGKYWRQMTEEQKRRYRNIFVRYGLSYYKTLPLEYAKGLTYEIRGAEVESGFVNVATNVHVQLGKEAQDVTLVFRLHKTSGQIKAVDVKVVESSLLLAYRGKFYEMIAQDDGEIDWFLEDLEDLTQSMERSLNEKALQQQKPLEFEK